MIAAWREGQEANDKSTDITKNERLSIMVASRNVSMLNAELTETVDRSTDIMANGKPSIIAASRKVSIADTEFTEFDESSHEDERMFDAELVSRLNVEGAGNNTGTFGSEGTHGEGMQVYGSYSDGIQSDISRMELFGGRVPHNTSSMEMLDAGSRSDGTRDINQMEGDMIVTNGNDVEMKSIDDNNNGGDSEAETVIATNPRRGRKRKSMGDGEGDSDGSSSSSAPSVVCYAFHFTYWKSLIVHLERISQHRAAKRGTYHQVWKRGKWSQDLRMFQLLIDIVTVQPIYRRLRSRRPERYYICRFRSRLDFHNRSRKLTDTESTRDSCEGQRRQTQRPGPRARARA
jgi:hypothetical protein